MTPPVHPRDRTGPEKADSWPEELDRTTLSADVSSAVKKDAHVSCVYYPSVRLIRPDRTRLDHPLSVRPPIWAGPDQIKLFALV